MSRDLLDRFDQATARIERVIPLFAAADGDAASDDACCFLENEFEEIERALGKLPAWLKDEDMGGCEFQGAFFEWLYRQGKFGFLVQFATPVMTHYTKTSRAFSWGYYNTEWVYGDTFEQALEAGFAWVESVRKREKQKPKKTRVTKTKARAKP